MIKEEQAQKLVNEYQLQLNKYELNNSRENLRALKKIETKCLNKLSYLVKMRVSKYRKFNNYDDLFQEGMIILLRSMKNYSSDKGSFFWWAHKYIGTRVFRSANTHSTIKVPLKVAKKTAPYKEVIMPILIEENLCPDIQYDTAENYDMIHSSINQLSDNQKKVLNLIFGFENTKPLTFNAICSELNISRSECNKLIHSALSQVKKSILDKNGGEIIIK